jgi:hypothetical protein
MLRVNIIFPFKNSCYAYLSQIDVLHPDMHVVPEALRDQIFSFCSCFIWVDKNQGAVLKKKGDILSIKKQILINSSCIH